MQIRHLQPLLRFIPQFAQICTVFALSKFKANPFFRPVKERVAILAKKVYLANIRQSLIKHSNEIAKEPFKSTDFEETGEFGENSQKTLEKVNNNNKKMIKGPLPEWRFWRKQKLKWNGRGPMRVAIMAKMAIDITKSSFQSGDCRAGMGAQAGELLLCES